MCTHMYHIHVMYIYVLMYTLLILVFCLCWFEGTYCIPVQDDTYVPHVDDRQKKTTKISVLYIVRTTNRTIQYSLQSLASVIIIKYLFVPFIFYLLYLVFCLNYILCKYYY